MKNKIIRKIYEYGVNNDIIEENRCVTNLNLDLTKQQKRVLVTYLNYNDASIKLKLGETHTNQSRLFQILLSFYRLGMIVDTCWCLDKNAWKYLEDNRYDVIFGFGEIFERACEVNPEAKKIIYMTEDPYDVAVTKEIERIVYFKQRHCIKKQKKILNNFENTRAGVFYSKGVENYADYVICQGNPVHFKDLNKPLYTVVPNAFKNIKFKNTQIKKEDNTFVMFGASALIRKGTDILIDTFEKHPEWELYLCDKNISKNLKEIGYTRLPKNVHDCGFININSEELINLFNRVRFILLPSCTEAPSSAVLTGMRHGLIPIVMEGIGLDLFDEFCFYFEDYHIESIELTIEKHMAMTQEEKRKKSELIYEYANANFTLEAFTEHMFSILKNICEF